MKTSYAVLSVFAMSVAGAAFAGGGSYPEPYLAESGPGKSRAEVIAEVKEAQRLGLLSVGEGDYPVIASAASGRSRAEVVAEMAEAQRHGLLTIGEEDAKVATSEQEQWIAAAGRRVAEQVRFAQGSK
jgi:hypothetical protein